MEYKWWPTTLADKKPEDLHPDTLRFIKAVNELVESNGGRYVSNDELVKEGA